MKIGIVCPYNIARGGGVQEVVRALCDDLNKRGHTAKIITPQPREIEDANLKDVIFIGGAADLYSPMHTFAQVSASVSTEAIDAVLEAEQFDVLHFHEPWVPMLSRQILSRSKSINVATFHAKIPETIVSQTVMKAVMPYLKSVLKYLDEITAVSDAAAEYIGTMTDQPITIIPNGIDLTSYARQPESVAVSENPMILYIGRLEKRKGLKFLIKAFQQVQAKQPDARLVIAGDGPDREKLEDMVGDLQLPNVTFLGYISDKQKHDLLSEATVFCSPAIFGESFGIVLLEAMAYNLPVVAGNNVGYASVMQGVGGLSLVNPEDSAEFARRLDMFINEAPIRKLWSSWARNYIKQYNYPAVIDQYEAAYELAIELHQDKPTLQPVE